MSETTFVQVSSEDESTGRLDPEGNPLQPLSEDHAELFIGLDRLLSIGSYYTPEHTRFQEVARQAHLAVRKNFSEETNLKVECTSEGCWVHGIFIEGDQKETRRVFELLTALNIGLLEIVSGVSADELQQGLSSLKQHQVKTAGKKTYEEVEIQGLPDTIQVTSQNLYVKTRGDTAGVSSTRTGAGDIDHHVIPDANLVPTPEGQKLEREFLSIVSGIMAKGDPSQLDEVAGDAAAFHAIVHEWVPDDAINAIKEIMEALKRTNTDPMIMEHLIEHAQAALQLTSDPLVVELVFAHLRKEIGAKNEKSNSLLENRPKPKKRKVKYTMTPEQMDEIIAELNAIADPPEDLLAPATADCLGICAQVLCSAPTEHMVLGIGATVYRMLSAETLPEDDVKITVAALVAIMETGSRETIDSSLPIFLTPLRKTHPELVGSVWLDVWKSLEDSSHQLLAWPHLVNELLMGIEWRDPSVKLALFEVLSRVDVGDGEAMLARLEELQALKGKMLSPDIFHAPAPLLYPVHLVLLGSTLAHEHGPKLFERLFHQRAQKLSNLLITIMGEYRQSNKLIYQAILDQGVDGMIQPKLQDLGSRLLATTIRNLKPENRDELWVPEAISWLGQLDAKRAKPILTKVFKEKKFFLFPVWPAECREIAKNALTGRPERLREAGPEAEEKSAAWPGTEENDER